MLLQGTISKNPANQGHLKSFINPGIAMIREIKFPIIKEPLCRPLNSTYSIIFGLLFKNLVLL